jgi:uncharacterized membrane protein YedE/YeeE
MGKSIMIGAGVIILILSIVRPAFFWNTRKALRMRRLIGDSAAMLLYIAISIFIIYIGITI